MSTGLALVEFLLTQITEDEERALASRSTLLIADLDRCGVPGSDEQATFRHHERWEPPRVLAECEAKRAILTEISRILPVCIDPMTPAGIVALAMAQPYADRPGFDPTWRAA